MNDVFVERQLIAALTPEDMQAIAISSAGCMRLHRVSWMGSLVSSDGMFCHFRGPDAESVRIAIQQAGGPPGRVWACSVRDAPGVSAADLASVTALVGHSFEEPAAFGAREVHDDIEMGCFQIHRVRPLRSYLSSDRRRMFTLYQAPDAESVRLAQREAGLPPDRVWAVRRYAP